MLAHFFVVGLSEEIAGVGNGYNVFRVFMIHGNKRGVGGCKKPSHFSDCIERGDKLDGRKRLHELFGCFCLE